MAAKMDVFLKLLGMTTSENDHEALVAIRKANAMLAKQNMTWEQFLKARKGLPNEGAKSTGAATPNSVGTPDEINMMLDALLTGLDPGSFRVFIEDIAEWWKKNGFLTSRQYNGLKKGYDNLRR